MRPADGRRADLGRRVVALLRRQLHHFVLLLAAPFLLVVLGLLADLLPQVVFRHFVVGDAVVAGCADGLEVERLCADLDADACMVRSNFEPILGQNQRAELTLVVLQYKLAGIFLIPESGMNARNRNILRNAHIHILLAPNVDLHLVPEGDELEYLAILLVLLLHDFEHEVGLLRLGDVDGVELLVVQVDAVLEVRLAHLAVQRLPVYRHAEVRNAGLDLLRQPHLQAQQVDVPHCPCALARRDQRVRRQSRLETDAAGVFAFGVVLQGGLVDADGLGRLPRNGLDVDGLGLLHALDVELIVVMKLLVNRLADPDILTISDDNRRVVVHGHDLPHFQLLLAQLDDIALPDGVALSGAGLTLEGRERTTSHSGFWISSAFSS